MSVQAAPQLEKPRKRTSAALYEVVVPLLATAAGFLVWEAICKAFNVPAYLVPAPSEILKDTLAIGPTVFGHSMATLKTVLLGFVVSIAISLPLAVLLTASPAIASALEMTTRCTSPVRTWPWATLVGVTTARLRLRAASLAEPKWLRMLATSVKASEPPKVSVKPASRALAPVCVATVTWPAPNSVSMPACKLARSCAGSAL